MKIGDTVMFVDEGCYARWFFGNLATVTHYTPRPAAPWTPGTEAVDRSTCRVKWMKPVKYHDRLSTVSDFYANMFEVICEK